LVHNLHINHIYALSGQQLYISMEDFQSIEPGEGESTGQTIATVDGAVGDEANFSDSKRRRSRKAAKRKLHLSN
jgi:hypothetical protein